MDLAMVILYMAPVIGVVVVALGAISLGFLFAVDVKDRFAMASADRGRRGGAPGHAGAQG